ncbi:hypothetical protein BG20_I2023 [Candidatus Nitrosarchaeum limnium BG20]|uniref:Uncharacterized protein n=1 Tax=Candidatus Nitrosarchaeum limnium BG20 TaxID=859192 RepID=S2E9W3_9ARCH|nr:hypothetical protein BG20_I2023 [Candidatus Nitrosarchaeum limnium BG20]
MSKTYLKFCTNWNVELKRPKCGKCSNPIPDTKDKMPYLIYH